MHSAAAMLLIAALAVAWVSVASAQEPAYPGATARIVDTAGLLRPQTRAALEALSAEVEQKTGSQIAVALVPSIAPLGIDEYAVRLFERWSVGQRGKDNGVLLVVARDERRIRIEVGYGLEGILPDGRVGGILRSHIVPRLQKNDWDGGISGGVMALASVIAEDSGVTLTGVPAGFQSQPERRMGRRGRKSSRFASLLGMGFMMLMFSSMRGRGRRGRRGMGLLPLIFLGGMGGGGFGGGGGGGGGGFGGFGGGFSGGGGASSGF